MRRWSARAARLAPALLLAWAASAHAARLDGGGPRGCVRDLETSAPSALATEPEAARPNAGAPGESAPASARNAADEARDANAAPASGLGGADDDELAGIDDGFLDEDLGPDPAERDHTPHWNRRVFRFNEGFIRWVMKPISRAYQVVTPRFVREMVARGFDNLESPVILANDLMQLDACRAGRTLGRFALNSTVGIGGMFDVAAEMGIARHDTDFGETLGRWGVRSGSYFMLPVLGPSTARDALGELVDTALRPEIWLVGGFPRLALAGGDGLATYDIEAERLDALRATSIDFYAALRSAYLMDRDAKIDGLRAAGRCGIERRESRDLPGS